MENGSGRYAPLPNRIDSGEGLNRCRDVQGRVVWVAPQVSYHHGLQRLANWHSKPDNV